MNNMRQLINLMEGVASIPGIGNTKIDEKSTSEKQARFMAAASHDPKFAKKVGIDQSVAKEFNKADTGTELLSKSAKNDESCSMEESHVSDGQMSNPGVAREILAMEDSGNDINFISSSIRQNYDLAASEEELKRMVAGETGYGQNPNFDNMFHSALDHFLNGDDTSFDHMGDEDDYTDQSMRAGEMGMEEATGARKPTIDPAEVNVMVSLPVDAAKMRAHEILAASTTSDVKKQYLARQIDAARNTMAVVKMLYDMILKGEGNGVQGSFYSRKFDEETMKEDFNNGYDTERRTDGNDYFPNGADSPVVKKVGPSGARQGDNPEQKKMQVAETHSELVYAYRKYLKESAKK